VVHYPGSASFAAVKGIIIVSANFVIETNLPVPQCFCLLVSAFLDRVFTVAYFSAHPEIFCGVITSFHFGNLT
jgi:hypothetical protein